MPYPFHFYSKMLLSVLKSKIHKASVTSTDMEYEGSISIDAQLLEASRISQYEQVDVYNVTNGARFTTYAIEAIYGSGSICVNGAAARLVAPSDVIIICSYAIIDSSEIKSHKPIVVLCGKDNVIP